MTLMTKSQHQRQKPLQFSKSTHQRNLNKSKKHVGAPTTQLSSDSNPKKDEGQCSKQPEKKTETERKFRNQWQVTRPWLYHDNGKMWCHICREHKDKILYYLKSKEMVDGTTAFK